MIGWNLAIWLPYCCITLFWLIRIMLSLTCATIQVVDLVIINRRCLEVRRLFCCWRCIKILFKTICSLLYCWILRSWRLHRYAQYLAVKQLFDNFLFRVGFSYPVVWTRHSLQNGVKCVNNNLHYHRTMSILFKGWQSNISHQEAFVYCRLTVGPTVDSR